MFKGCLALVVFGGVFILLIVCFPFHYLDQEAAPVAAVEVAATPNVEDHFATVCNNASIDMFGTDYAEYDQAVQYCMNGLMYSYSQLGHWPGPEMNGNVSNAFLAAQQAADFWALLDTPFLYRSEDGRETIMEFLKLERETYGL